MHRAGAQTVGQAVDQIVDGRRRRRRRPGQVKRARRRAQLVDGDRFENQHVKAEAGVESFKMRLQQGQEASGVTARSAHPDTGLTRRAVDPEAQQAELADALVIGGQTFNQAGQQALAGGCHIADQGDRFGQGQAHPIGRDHLRRGDWLIGAAKGLIQALTKGFAETGDQWRARQVV